MAKNTIKVDKIEPEGTNIRVSTESKNLVKEHVKQYGGKLGKFYEIAAQEKIERDTKKE